MSEKQKLFSIRFAESSFLKAPFFLIFTNLILGLLSSKAQTGSSLIWNDEFDVNGQIDTSKWFQQYILPNGQTWFSGEIQHYTQREENAFVKDGNLHIVAQKENYASQGVAKDYTSARLNSKVAFKYGRIETRAKMPTGFGLWTAVWTLGQDIIENGAYWNKNHGSIQWPACGEINMLEYWGKSPNNILGGVHAPNGWGAGAHQGSLNVDSAETTFHVYETIWNPFEVIFKVDGFEYYRYAPKDKNENSWPLNNKHYLLANIAVRPDIDTNLQKAELLIDYIRVYQTDTLTGFNTIEKGANKVEIYPNPSSEAIWISLAQELIGGEIEIVNLVGNTVLQMGIAKASQQIDIQNLPKGIYIISLKNEGYSVLKKFVKT